mmetsp:Transcript_133308/g.285042  ORF Transcript_133308/g.285042 Transcript_133308/m.285042 type:complete len:219 (+) Transcript_133308:662-1318(+)
MPIATTETEGGYLAVAAVKGISSVLGLEYGVEGFVLQVRIQTAQVSRAQALGRPALNDALAHRGHGSSSLGMTHVGLDRCDHQGLLARHPDLHLAHRAYLNGVAKRCTSAVALPDRRFRRHHMGFLDGLADDLLLCWAIWGCKTGAATVLTDRRATKDSLTRPTKRPKLHHETTDTFAAQVAIRRRVKGEATPFCGVHVGLGSADVALYSVEEQLGPH